MKVFFDSNVIISAILSSKGTPFQAIQKAGNGGCEMVVSELNLEEVIDNVLTKFPNKKKALDSFVEYLRYTATIVSVPKMVVKAEAKIRDEDDRPILRAAIMADVDVIVTGDKDFLESGIEWPLIMSPAEFMSYNLTPPDDPLHVAEP